MERRRRIRPLLSSLTQIQTQDQLGLDRTGDRTPEMWFIGPRAENGDLFMRLVDRALAAHMAFRRDYMPGDPPTHRDDGSGRLAASEQFLTDRLDEMLGYLRGSVPLASHRNLSHMYWDQTMPALLGYIAALPYNQNNVAAEASPATTLFEIEVGRDLCRMLGYPQPSAAQQSEGAVTPWGHITCDGSVANAESLWAARNLKYFAPAMAAALRAEPDLAPARAVSVQLPGGGRARLLDLTPWQVMNLPLDEVIGLAPRVSAVSGIPPQVIEAALARHSVQSVGLVAFHRRHLPDMDPPVLLAPATAHYSWPKGMSLIGLGREALRMIRVDLSGRMDMVALRAVLDTCLDAQQPVMQVTAVLGSTEESAVDPLADILAIRDEYRAMGMEFSVHADGAWGGYFASMLRAPHGHHGAGHVPEPADDARRALLLGDGKDSPGLMLSPYVRQQMRALPGADTITVDPHKSGFAPYPAGALCYRNGAMRDMVSFTAPVVFHGGVDPTVGVYGIEGSKPGAAAASVYLSHRVIRTDRSGYGDLLARCLFNAKRFFAMLVCLEGPDFTLTPFQRLPAEATPGATASDIAAQKHRIRNDILPLADADLVDALREDADLYALFRDMGPDLTIAAYAFNFVQAGGPNRDPVLMNEMNDLIYRRLSLQSFNGGTVPVTPMFITSSEFDPQTYGQGFVDDFAARAGVQPQAGLAMSFLISTTQNPWLSEAGGGDVLKTLRDVLSDTASSAAQAVMARHGIAPA
ncbi:MAG: pyridoxal phosphate-dependent decarboxylase family protein [Paracoccus sp. (in: a-proteobacteria)]|uniref:pyridoxal phosphate-dependent decarboxylase family protein n=1 Tax=Paracoccus sp. TaxID=267 RepID=UPI00391962FB